ncbi:MAG: hypothetical protein QW812_02240, partial [Thermoplasmataceae archaeon]
TERLVREGDRDVGQSSQRRSIYLAILKATDQAAGREWMFSQSEKELAWKLLPFVNEILKGGPERLRENIAPLRGIIG